MRTDVVVIGAGQAGLAMSRCLTRAGIEHVVLERRRIAERWRSERWESLRLLTPNWLTRLPGWRYAGRDPDGFMAMTDVIRFLEDYARSFGAPVVPDAEVSSLTWHDGAYRVRTGRGAWRADGVVIATGHCDVPSVPDSAANLPPGILQLSPPRYRQPDDLPKGGVLVVGASASGVQIADELCRSGRHVTLSVGRHTRLPRRYRGRDILWWLDRAGVLGERVEDMPDPEAARAQPSLQLIGGPSGKSIDLGTLEAQGVRVLGRATEVAGGTVHLAGDLRETTEAADRKLRRLLARVDRFAGACGLSDRRPDPPEPIRIGAPAASLDLAREGIETVIWATGYRRRYPWLQVPVLDHRGEIVHRGGVTACPGLFVLGLRLLRRRSSSFIDGVGRDAEELAGAIAAHLSSRRRLAA